MKRSWMGFGLLLILLLLGIITTWFMVDIHQPVEENLKKASQCALRGDWIQADAYFREAKENWKQWEHERACLADHTPVEDIDAEFEMLQLYSTAREDAAFAAGCLELARKAAAVGEAHEFVWWNFL